MDELRRICKGDKGLTETAARNGLRSLLSLVPALDPNNPNNDELLRSRRLLADVADHIAGLEDERDRLILGWVCFKLPDGQHPRTSLSLTRRRIEANTQRAKEPPLLEELLKDLAARYDVPLQPPMALPNVSRVEQRIPGERPASPPPLHTLTLVTAHSGTSLAEGMRKFLRNHCCCSTFSLPRRKYAASPFRELCLARDLEASEALYKRRLRPPRHVVAYHPTADEELRATNSLASEFFRPTTNHNDGPFTIDADETERFKAMAAPLVNSLRAAIDRPMAPGESKLHSAVGQRFLERLRDDGGFHVEFGQGSEGHSSQAQTRRAARIDAAGEQIIACIQGDLGVNNLWTRSVFSPAVTWLNEDDAALHQGETEPARVAAVIAHAVRGALSDRSENALARTPS